MYQRKARDIRRGLVDNGANCLLALGTKGAVGRGEVEGLLPLGQGKGGDRLLAWEACGGSWERRGSEGGVWLGQQQRRFVDGLGAGALPCFS